MVRELIPFVIDSAKNRLEMVQVLKVEVGIEES